MPANRTLATFLLILAGTVASFSLQADELSEIARQMRNGQHAAALAQTDEYLKTHPADPQAMFFKGVALSKLNKRNDAIRAFVAMTEKHPDLPEPYNNLAVLYAEQGQFDKARKALEAALNTHSSYATAHGNLANVYAYMASEAYDKALQLDKKKIRPASSRLAMISDLNSAGESTMLAAASQPEMRGQGKPAAITPGFSVQPTRPAEPIKLAEAVKPAEPHQLAEPTKPAEVAKPAEPSNLAEPTKPVETTKTPAPVMPALQAPVEEPVAQAPQPTKVVKEKAPAKADNAKPTSPSIVAEPKIKEAVDAWALAWSSQNVEKYLASYADSFKTPNGESRKQWEDTRRSRLTKPGTIKVEITGLRVVAENDNRARAEFKQTYRSGRTVMRTNKILILKQTGGRWLIEQEQTGS